MSNSTQPRIVVWRSFIVRPSVVSAEKIARAAHHQHLAVADDGRADREKGALRIGTRVRHYFTLRMILSGNRLPSPTEVEAVL